MVLLDRVLQLLGGETALVQESIIPALESIKDYCYVGAKQLEWCEWGTIFAPVVVYWIYSSMFYFASYFKLSPIETHRLPTNQKGRFQNRMTVGHVLRTVLMQHIVQAVVAFLVAVYVHEPEGPGPVNWPLAAVQFIAGCFVIDTYQYWMHRMMHTSRTLYRMLHSVHHQLTVPYAFGALYNHPIEGFLMDTLSGAVSSVITGMHPWTAVVFYTFATMKTVDDHCGFDLWWDPLQRLFPNNAAYHDRHHWGKGIRYNYSQPFFTFWDSWCGTQWKDQLTELAPAKEVDTASALGKPQPQAKTIRKRLINTEKINGTSIAPTQQKHPQSAKKITDSQKQIAAPVLACWELGSNISKSQILATKLTVCKK